MKNLSPKQFYLLANCFERIRNHEAMIESSWINSKLLVYLTKSKTFVLSLDQQMVYRKPRLLS